MSAYTPKYIVIVSLVVISFAGSGCMTLLRDKETAVNVATDPTGAIVVIGDGTHSLTPTVIKIPRKSAEIVIKKDGYEQKTVSITTYQNGWAWTGSIFFNLVLLGALFPLGIGVDISNGVLQDIDPDIISETLVPVAGKETEIGKPNIDLPVKSGSRTEDEGFQ